MFSGTRAQFDVTDFQHAEIRARVSVSVPIRLSVLLARSVK